MASDYIDKLFDLIFTPYGLVGIAIGLIVLDRARLSRRLAWLMLSLCCYAASLGKFINEWITEPPALVFPLDQLRNIGRPLTIVLLILLLVLGLQTKNGWHPPFISKPIKYLIVVQSVIFFKTFIYGDFVFALLSILTFGSVVMMIQLGPNRWLQDRKNFYLAIWSLAMATTIFTLTNSYQVSVNMYAVTFVNGRFLGTTGNPQQAASILANTIPCFIFLIESNKKLSWMKVFWIASLFIDAYFLFLTGSRTAVIMAGMSILFFYYNKLGHLLRIGMFAGIIIAILFPYIDQSIVISNPLIDRYIAGGNTRESAWSGMLNGFINYPIFGVPLEAGRLGYGESSWLAAASTTGLLGFIPLLMVGIESLKMIIKLIQLSNIKPSYSLQINTVIAGLVSILVESFSEATLLGSLSFPLIVLFIYLCLGKYLLDVAHIERNYFLTQVQLNQII